MSLNTAIDVILQYLIAWSIWLAFVWYLVSKFGYRDKGRSTWMVLLGMPPINDLFQSILVVSLLALIFLPWPIHKELRALRQQVDRLHGKPSSFKK